MKTSSPRTFSSMVTQTSLSANRFTWALVSGTSRCAATASASVRLELPASSFMGAPQTNSLWAGLVAGARESARLSLQHDRAEQASVVGFAQLEGAPVGEEEVRLGAGVAADPLAGFDAGGL